MNQKYINKVTKGDSLKKLKLLDDKSIDLVILDPPYHKVVNEYWDNEHKSLDEYLNWSRKYIKELGRVSKDSASVWFYGFSMQLTYLIPIMEKNGFTFRQYIVLDKGLKSIAGRSSNKLKQYPTATEYIAFFYKESKGKIMNELQRNKKLGKKSSKEINEYLGKASNGGGTWSSVAGLKQKNLQYPTRKDWNLLKTLFDDFDWEYDDYVFKFHLQSGLTDVWSDINFYIKKRIHPTQKPDKLTERLIITSSNKGDVILDPFSGSGSTAKSAIKLDRNFITFERDQEFYDITKKIIKEAIKEKNDK